MFTRARTILEKVRFKMPREPDNSSSAQLQAVWLASIRLERTCDNEKVAQQLLARALQGCPDSGPLQTLAIEMEPQAETRMRKARDAAPLVKDDPSIFVAMGKVFWVEKKTTKARRWLTKATELGPDNGDTWLHLLKFEQECGDSESVEQVKAGFMKAEPRHGELWTREIKKVANWRRDPFTVLDGMKVTLPEY